ncbi:hypothetical protein TI04_13115, partial [Achromatium sp. WMS2]
ILGSETKAKGQAGNVTVHAGALTINGGYITSQSGYDAPTATGNAGAISIVVTGAMQILNGGLVLDGTFAGGNAGEIIINAGSLLIDGNGNPVTGISAGPYYGSTGNSNLVDITVHGLTQITRSGNIVNQALATKDAGKISLNTKNLVIDGQGSNTTIASRAVPNSSGAAGEITVTVTQDIQILQGGQILSTTEGTGNGGVVKVTAQNLTIDSQGYTQGFTGISSGSKSGGTAGNIEITATGLLQLINGGQIQGSAYAQGDAGTITVTANNLFIDNQNFSSTNVT